MRIHEFVWPQDRVDHIARHGVTPEEVEEACFGQTVVQRAKSEGENPVYYVLGKLRVEGICSALLFGSRTAGDILLLQGR